MKREKKLKILKAKICPHCGKRPEIVKSDEIYGKGHNYGWMYWCKKCDAYVGCHKGTTNPLGRLANKELREAKKAAHRAFDPLWKNGDMSRAEAYAWLSEALGVKEEYTHIGMFSMRYCKKTIEVCNDFRR